MLSKSAIWTGAVLGFLLIVGLMFAGNYNSMVASRNKTTQSWGTVETAYQRRFDLIGNLVSSVKGAQGQEQAVFGKIADARAAYASASNPSDKAKAASQIETNVALVPRLQEAYPDLKSNQQVTQLMNQLTGTEDGIMSARNAYNDQATKFNTSIERFPSNVFAGLYGFKEFTLFKADPGAATAPKVDFSK